FTWEFFLATKDETSPILKTFITGLGNQLSLKELKGNTVYQTPQQHGIAERKNRTLIEAARTMLVDSLLPISFWAEAVNTACYVQNRVLVTKSHNKTPYELLHGRPPSIGFMRPFSYPVTILNTLDSLGKFEGKVDEGFLVGYSLSSKAFRVFKSRTRVVQETLHVNFLENKPNIACSGPTWLFDIDSLTRTLNYQPVTAGNQTNPSAEFEDCSNNSINEVNAAGTMVPTVGQNSPNSTNTFSATDASQLPNDPDMPELEDITYSDNEEEDVGAEADFNNLENASQLPNDPDMPELEDITYSDNEEEDVGAEADFNNLESSITEQLFKFKMQKVWVLVDLPHGKRAIGTKWIFRNKKDERGIVVRNKARLVAQGHTQEEGNDYEEVFASVARIEAIRLFLAYASFMGFMVYQMDVKSAFLYGTIEEEVCVCQPLGFEDPDYLDKVYKVVKALYGLHQAPRSWYETLANYLLENGFQIGKIDLTLFIKK
nr:hypothetical protein [Tanacetum cinerariifolium]